MKQQLDFSTNISNPFSNGLAEALSAANNAFSRNVDAKKRDIALQNEQQANQQMVSKFNIDQDSLAGSLISKTPQPVAAETKQPTVAPVPVKTSVITPVTTKQPSTQVYTGDEKARQQFVQDITPAANRVAKEIGVPTEAIIGQWAHETGWGSKVIPGTFNLGNIKATNGDTNYASVKATEYDSSGNPYTENAKFKKYSSWDEGAQGYLDFLKSNPRYNQALKAGNANDYFTALQKAGYATDPKYAQYMKQMIPSVQKRMV